MLYHLVSEALNNTDSHVPVDRRVLSSWMTTTNVPEADVDDYVHVTLSESPRVALPTEPIRALGSTIRGYALTALRQYALAVQACVKVSVTLIAVYLCTTDEVYNE